ncbi:MAG: YfiR family protein [Bacteroidota bacterium]
MQAHKTHETIRSRVKAICATAGFLLLIVQPSGMYAQSASEVEYRFKAVYLFNFLQLIEWPTTAFDSDESPLVVGILGKDPFGRLLDDLLKKERINERPVVIRRFEDYEDVEKCHLLFVSDSEGDRIPAILRQAQQRQALTVSEIVGFAERGGGINFYIENNRIKFEINVDALRRADLHASSKLLRLARLVKPSKDG